MQEKQDELISELDTRLIDHERNKKLKSEYLYLKGKTLDFSSDLKMQKEAEELLTKAIKLRPSWDDPLNALGHVYWKKKDYENAIMCYRQTGDENKHALRNLSMVIRQQPGLSIEDRINAQKESIDLANKAVALDITDAHSWYILGNFHLTCYFIDTNRYEHLNYALKAYTQSEKSQNEEYPNPDLYFNRGTIKDYLEHYQAASADYEKADEIDPNLGASIKAAKVKEFVTTTYRMLTKRKNHKNDKDTKLVKSVPTTIGEVRFALDEKQEEVKEAIKFTIKGMNDLENG